MGSIFPQIGSTYYLPDKVHNCVWTVIVKRSGMPRVGEVEVLKPEGDLIQGFEQRPVMVDVRDLCMDFENAIKRLLGAHESEIRCNTAAINNKINYQGETT